MALASARPYASHLHLGSRQPHQYLTTKFLHAGCPSCQPTSTKGTTVLLLWAADNLRNWGTWPSQFKTPITPETHEKICQTLTVNRTQLHEASHKTSNFVTTAQRKRLLWEFIIKYSYSLVNFKFWWSHTHTPASMGWNLANFIPNVLHIWLKNDEIGPSNLNTGACIAHMMPVIMSTYMYRVCQ